MKHLLLICAAFLFTGCISTTDPVNMKANVTEATAISESSNLYKNILLGDVTGGNKGNLSVNSKISNTEFFDALYESLSAHKMFTRKDGDYKLDAKLVKVNQPIIGIDMKTTATVQYILTEIKTGSSVFDKTVTETYTAKFGDSIIGYMRAQMAVEGAVSANISSMLELLVQELGGDEDIKISLNLSSVNSAT